mgnify:CR=1 FL=1
MERLTTNNPQDNIQTALKLAAQCLGTTPDHLRELVQAEKDGRLVVLPCNETDPV